MQLQFIMLTLTRCILRLFFIHHLFLNGRRAAKSGHWTGVTQLENGKKLLKRILDFISALQKIKTMLRKLGTGKIK